ncbi:hypothetical protein BCR43DRAFT_489320 [Syncephalastrum racemosum]|uniref:C3H1-type domain-containing protein n=1 Tax=Syncephalastrum racemosum TaxID=13706 RepID=A0A1X2HK66_SYNRA|nr:hypothetical protein BCR43DRAFT_489320 [Syncephalastrum racemosum]
MKRYYCEFCQCSFPDNKTNRQRHMEGGNHQLNRRLHYDSFKDPAQLIEEYCAKPPCRRFFTQGQCPYSLQCRYSHVSFDPTGRPIYPHELKELLDAIARPASPTKEKVKVERVRLPRGWRLRDLPPSLIPPKRPYDLRDVATWGE